MTASILSRRPADEASIITLPGPYLLFLGDVVEPGYAKTAFGLRDWARDRCVGEFALPEAAITTAREERSPLPGRVRCTPPWRPGSTSSRECTIGSAICPG